MDFETKTEKVIKHLERYGSITPLEADRKYNLLRLGSVICDLRHKRGFIIETETVYLRDKKGKVRGRYAKYIYHGRKDD